MADERFLAAARALGGQNPVIRSMETALPKPMPRITREDMVRALMRRKAGMALQGMQPQPQYQNLPYVSGQGPNPVMRTLSHVQGSEPATLNLLNDTSIPGPR